MLAACSSLSSNDDGIATLDIRLPANFYLEAAGTVHLDAVARDENGEVVAATLVWRTPDTTVAVDSAAGDVTALAASGKARVQVAVLGSGSLISNLNSLAFTLTGRADSLDRDGPDSLTVAGDAEPSGPLAIRLLALPDESGVSGRPIGFRIIEPVFTDDTTAVLSTGKVRDSLISGPTGAPPTPVTVRAVAGRTPPDRVVVEVTAFRANGDPIPGSGQRFVIRFLHQ